MKTADPRVKLLAILVTSTLAISCKNIPNLLILSLVSLGFCFLFGGNFSLIKGRFAHFIPVLLVVIALQAIFVRSGEILLKVGTFPLVYSDGLSRGFSSIFRLFILFTSAAILSAENSRKVIASLEKLKIPYEICFMMMICLRFIPYFAQGFSDCLTAIQLRGVDLKKVPWKKRLYVYSKILTPIIANSILSAQDLTIAMEGRGFGAFGKRTNFLNPIMRVSDYIVLFFILLFAISFSLHLYL